MGLQGISTVRQTQGRQQEDTEGWRGGYHMSKGIQGPKKGWSLDSTVRQTQVRNGVLGGWWKEKRKKMSLSIKHLFLVKCCCI